MIRKTVFCLVALLLTAPCLLAGDVELLGVMINDWRHAWQNRDLARYLSYYSLSFRSDELDYYGWRQKKEGLFQSLQDISVEVDALEISVEETRAVARFIQKYRSPTLSDVGTKTLVFDREKGPWKIVSETWEPLPKPDVLSPRETESGDGVGLEPTESVSDPAAQFSAIPKEELKAELFEAVKWDRLEGVMDLLSKGADIRVKDEDGKTPLHWASFWGYLDIVEVLVTSGADVNALEDQTGATPLYAAVIGAGKADVVAYLLDMGADVNFRSKYGRTPIHSAKAEAAAILIDRGAEINGVDATGRTPLHIAAYMGRREVAKLLLSNGADRAKKDRFGLTPAEYAESLGYKDLADLLGQD